MPETSFTSRKHLVSFCEVVFEVASGSSVGDGTNERVEGTHLLLYAMSQLCQDPSIVLAIEGNVSMPAYASLAGLSKP